MTCQQGFYDPPSELVAWVKKEKTFFLTSADVRLRPRGLLLDGKPGTGKTAGSKWIAEQFGVPLYRMDIGGTKGKLRRRLGDGAALAFQPAGRRRSRLSA